MLVSRDESSGLYPVSTRAASPVVTGQLLTDNRQLIQLRLTPPNGLLPDFRAPAALGTLGVCQTLVQALLPGPATKLLGERGAVLAGLACACITLVAMAFAKQGWIVFAIMPIFPLGARSV
jgi:hypothetical protein